MMNDSGHGTCSAADCGRPAKGWAAESAAHPQHTRRTNATKHGSVGHGARCGAGLRLCVAADTDARHLQHLSISTRSGRHVVPSWRGCKAGGTIMKHHGEGPPPSRQAAAALRQLDAPEQCVPPRSGWRQSNVRCSPGTARAKSCRRRQGIGRWSTRRAAERQHYSSAARSTSNS